MANNVQLTFKFQSDSINTEKFLQKTPLMFPLNSNLILLIQAEIVVQARKDMPLNSNLILLIRGKDAGTYETI